MTKKEIEKMVIEGNTGEYSHFIIYCDHWDYTYGCVYVKHGDDINRIITNIKACSSPGMFSIEEIYNYNLDLKKQLNETRAYHIEPLGLKKKEEMVLEKKKSEESKAQDMHISLNLKKAIDYAISLHDGQYRQDGSPYIKHSLNVVQNVLKYKKSKNLETLLISACLHDTLEDTEATYYDIVREFGAQVASIVLELTTDEDMKNVLGKENYLAIKMKNMSSWALVIKLCDRLDNISDLDASDDTFKNKYINETIGILDYLLKNGKLSKTHISIIEQILSKLFDLNEKDEERTKRLVELAKMVLMHKEKLEGNSGIFNKLLERSEYLYEKDNMEWYKRLLL